MAKKQESGYKWTQHSSAAGVGIGLGTVFLLCLAFLQATTKRIQRHSNYIAVSSTFN